MQKVLFEQFLNKTKTMNLNMVINMLKGAQDYDADHQKPVPGAYPNIKNRPVPKSYLRRLEDIDESWVRNYLTWALTGLKINKNGGVRQYYERHQEARVYVGNEGESTDEGELLIDHGEFSPIDIAEAKSKLPYILKRLHNKSIQMRVSAMSLIIAYEKAKVIAKVPRPKDILENGVYRMGQNGNLDGLFPESANSGKVFPPACDWIRGRARDSYFDDALELLRICGVLGIDIRKEDPKDFQAADIDNLKVTYILKNRDYLRGAHQRNLSVLDSLASIKVADYVAPKRKDLPLTVKIMNTVQAVLDCSDLAVQNLLNEEPNPTVLNSFFQVYSSFAKDFKITKRQHMQMISGRDTTPIVHSKALITPTLDDFITRDGFLYSPLNNSIPQLFRVRKFTEKNIDASIAIAHSSGYFFLVTEGNCLYYLDAGELRSYIKDYVDQKFNNRYRKNHRYGRWEVCFV